MSDNSDSDSGFDSDSEHPEDFSDVDIDGYTFVGRPSEDRHTVCTDYQFPADEQRLAGLDLSWAEMSGCGLAGANLSRTNLTDADLRRVILNGADLSHASLARADMRAADLDNANLNDASFGHARLDRATMNGATFDGTSFTGTLIAPPFNVTATVAPGTPAVDGRTYIPQPVGISGAVGFPRCVPAEGDGLVAPGDPAQVFFAEVRDATGGTARSIVVLRVVDTATHPRSHVNGCEIVDGPLDPINRRTVCQQWNFAGADLSALDLSYADLGGSDFAGANLSGATLIQAHMTGCHLAGVRMMGALLEGAHLDGGDMRTARLGDAKLSGATLTDTVLANADFYRADLTGAVLTRANLTNVGFVGAKLCRADLRNTNAARAMFWHTDLRGVNFDGAILAGAKFDNTVLTPPKRSAIGAYGKPIDLSDFWGRLRGKFALPGRVNPLHHGPMELTGLRFLKCEYNAGNEDWRTVVPPPSRDVPKPIDLKFSYQDSHDNVITETTAVTVVHSIG